MYVKMHRFVALLLLGILLMAMAACGPSQVPGQPGVAPTSTPTACEDTSTPIPSPTPTPRPAPSTTPAPVPSPTPAPVKPGVPAAPVSAGKVILVSLSRQWLYAYAAGTPAFNNAVETGRPELPTPTGRFSVLSKLRDVTFTSPWPVGSPYYYGPTQVNYALLFKAGGFFLHDAWWHVTFGPGSNVPHQLPDGRWETGSHGCVGMPIPDAKRLYDWTPVGTPVFIRD
jgi:lipoprotein-anchoring transpeptidase ErfK/SrfK